MSTTVTRLLAAAVGGLAVAALAQDTCETVEATTTISMLKPLTLAYAGEQSEYWSTSCTDLKPTCILTPANEEEVAAIVKILRGNNETFAIKSGGHNPNNYFASVDGGPLLSTVNLNEVIFDAATETVRIGPGNRWEDVAGALDGTGYSVVGGRIGNVGVGGYMLGGGLSFMSTEYGWAANSVLEYTVVLANASIITVSEASHPELFVALKGGGNNFGIVTSYLVQAYAQGDVWGGTITYDANDATVPALMAAVRDFTEYYPDDKAGIIFTAERTLGTLVDLFIVFFYYNGPEPPADLFANFTAVPHIADTTQTQSLSALLTANNFGVLKGSVYTIGTETLPLPSSENGTAVLQSFYDSWVEVSNTAQGLLGVIATIAFQPLPRAVARAARAHGGAAGDMLDLDEDVDRIVIELDYSFLLNSDYATVDGIMRQTYGGFGDLVAGYQDQGVMPADVYLPLFQNDCFYPQDYFGRLRPERAELARRVRDEVDPEGFFRDRTGGFKIGS
ncbi:FAD binding domain-containing protein [Xylariomycetidae sp. FL2044]|nr:FAD binding domain-containing protein [Xylariomycetidae sp. FL2044]